MSKLRSQSFLLYSIFLGCMFLAHSATAQTTAPNQWTWVGGYDLIPPDVTPVYGNKGVESPESTPITYFAAYGSATWADQSGNLWLIPNGDNDLWKFDTATEEWAWMSGYGDCSAKSDLACLAERNFGVYGTQGVAAADNIPGARWGSVNWVDAKGHLWLFGGTGYDIGDATPGLLNDLWEYDPATNMWTWIGGKKAMTCVQGIIAPTCSSPAVYGTLGVPATGNVPGGRTDAAGWVDQSGNLWFFDSELWVYYTSTGQWAWMGGGNSSNCGTQCANPVYGTLGVPSSGNWPGGWSEPTIWTDKDYNFWIFGGVGRQNELWVYYTAKGQWAWMGGTNSVLCGYTCLVTGNYGTLGTPAKDNIPPPRFSAVGWTDNANNLWMFGGNSYGADYQVGNQFYGTEQDLWRYSIAANEWTWMGGSNVVPDSDSEWGTQPGQPGVYGTEGIPAVGNIPGARHSAAVWTDSSGNLWLYGGWGGIGSTEVPGNLEDLWVYQPSTDPLPTTATPQFSEPGGYYIPQQTVSLSDTTNGATIYYTTDGTTPSTASTVYSSPISVIKNTTIQAISTASGALPSAVASATYNLAPQVATPTFSVPNGTYSVMQTVSISDATPNSIIYYTTDGSTPTTSSKVYSSPITIAPALLPGATDAVEMLEAIAVASNYSNSAVESEMFNMTLPTFLVPSSIGLTGNTTPISVVPYNGFTGSVALTAVITSSPAGAIDIPTLSFGSTTPVLITGTTTGTATLTITTTSASTTTCTAMNRKHGGIPWQTSGSVVLACLLLMGIPAKRRTSRNLLGMMILLAALAGAPVGCGGGGGASSGSGSGCTSVATGGTTAGEYLITITATSGSINQTATVALTVQ